MQPATTKAWSKSTSSLDPHSIRWRFILFISLAVIIGFCTTALWTTYQIRQETELVAIEKVKADSNLAEALLDSRVPGPWQVREGKLYKGNTLVNEDFPFVNEVAQQTGDTCSIFLGDTRIATTVTREGKRVIGTKVSAEVAQVVLDNGREFLGEANVVGIKYQTAYRPLKNEAGQVIGMWYVGANKSFVDKIFYDTVRHVGLAFLMGWLVIISVVWLLTTSLIKPLNSLVYAANRLASGDLDTEIIIHSKDEVGFLAQAFDQMREKLRLHNQNLESLVSERTAELTQAYAELKQLDELKSSFLSTVSHELRTPLTSVLGFAKIIQRKLDEVLFPLVPTGDKRVTKAVQQVTSNIDIIVTEGERLTNLINDVLDLAKMESGKVEWKTGPISLKDVIERAVSASESLWSQKNLTVTVDIPNELPIVRGDYDRLFQVMLNLLSNAVKFTESGSIICHAEHVGADIIVSVTDTGIGIAHDVQATVFEKFKQIGDTLTEKPSGTGLGLPICKQIVERHGGKVWVNSEPGVGSSFYFCLPVSQQQKSTPLKINVDKLLNQVKYHVSTNTKSAGNTKNILVVDDDASIRTLLHQELEANGYTVIEATDGLNALDIVYSAVKHASTIPDLIILDVMMPKMSGFDVAAAFKTNPDTMQIPIVILSVIEDQRRGCLIGVDRYLTKPVNMDLLLNEIATLLSLNNSRKNILVVDEDQEILQHLTTAFADSGFTVYSASDSQECIQKAKTEQPGVIIIDNLLAEQHGVVQSLRNEKGLENVHFFLLAKVAKKEDAG